MGNGERREECPEAERKDGAYAPGQQPESSFSLEGLKKEFVPRIERARTGVSKRPPHSAGATASWSIRTGKSALSASR